jgi:hypothetical protein
MLPNVWLNANLFKFILNELNIIFTNKKSYGKDTLEKTI